VSETASGVVSALRVAPPPAQVDMAAAEQAAAQFMLALGLDTAEAGLRRTPRRVARAYAELFTPRESS
jgi:GTP cyclohydrolase I